MRDSANCFCEGLVVNIFALQVTYKLYLIFLFLSFYNPFKMCAPFLAYLKERPLVELDH